MAEMTLRKALEKAVATEAQGERYYKHMAETFAGNTAVAAVFEQLAADESEHEAQFKRLLESVPGDRSAGEEGEALLRAAFTVDSFDDKKMADFADVTSPADALARALAFEKSTLFYYQSLKDVIGQSAELDALIAAEKQHVTSLMKVIVSDAEFRGIADNW